MLFFYRVSLAKVAGGDSSRIVANARRSEWRKGFYPLRCSGAGRCKSLCGLFLNKVCKCLQELLRCLAFVTLKATKMKKLFYCGGEKSLLESSKPRFLHCTKNFCTLGGFAKRKHSPLCLKFFFIPTKRKFQLRLGTWSVLSCEVNAPKLKNRFIVT